MSTTYVNENINLKKYGSTNYAEPLFNIAFPGYVLPTWKKVVKFHVFCFRTRKEFLKLAYQSIETRNFHLARQTKNKSVQGG